MNANQPSGNLPEGLAQKLRAIRRRAFGVALAQAGILALAALLGCMAVAMALDWNFAWLKSWPRYTATFLTVAITLGVLWRFRPHARTIRTTAREVDEALPQLEERWSTVTELSQNQDSPEVRGSEAMIHRVESEADAAAKAITPDSLVSGKPVLRAARWLSGAVAALVILFTINFTEAGLLLQRFWMPGKDISLTRISASPANAWVPRSEPLTLKAEVKGRIPKKAPEIVVRSGSGQAVRAPMTGRGRAFQHAIEDVSDSFEYRVQAGDGETAWLPITAVDRPRISEVKLKVTPPAYSRLQSDEQNSLPQAVRILEGSDLQLSFRADQSLERMYLDFGDGKSAQLTSIGDNWYSFAARPTNSFSFAAAALNKFKLENKTKPSCRITVYEDLAPTVKILEPTEDVAVLPGEKVEVAFEAKDDFGIAKAELKIETTKSDGETNSITIPVDLQDNAGKKQLKQNVQIDTKALGLKHGDQISYTVQVTDTKEVPASATAEATAQNQEAEKPGEASSQLAEAKAGEPKKANELEPAKSSESQASKTAGKPKTDQTSQNTAESKPDEMSKRMLDVGQTAACKPRNISVDEYAGSFDGEKRKKLEIAIEPVLKRLDQLLAQAQTNTIELKVAIRPEPLEAAKTNLVAAKHSVGDLTSRTAGTPYAFIGLQLQNITQAHISPAHDNLSTETNIDQAVFHITRAREMLADLTKTYESVKRDQQIADAMQRLSKMYQIFLEDTQALLGNRKDPINSYDRKIAEVDEEFAEKLKELLEERKKIMAELAKILADDPRMLRRYLAMMELQGTTLRDQFTLLAERQKEMQQQLAEWNATPEAERPALAEKLRQSYEKQNEKVVQDAVKLRENMETWLPLDVKPDQEQVQSALARAEKIARLAAERNTNSAGQALSEMHALRESLPQLSAVNSTNKAKLATYIANRLPEVESLITEHSGQMKIAESLQTGDFPKVAEVVQHRIHQDTYTLGEKLITAEEQVGQMSEQIFQTAASLNRTVQGDIIHPQRSSVEKLAAREIKPAEEIINKLPPTFENAEKTFDDLMRQIIAELDKAPPPQGSPGGAGSVEDILAMLEDEAKACENLGIPCRPLNVSVMRDWMRPSSGQGQGMGRAQAQAAAAQAREGQDAAQRMQKQARDSARKALGEAKKQRADLANSADAGTGRPRSDAWNKLASRLQKDLLQGRDNTPPEQYREAIEAYFRIISEATPAPEK